MKRRYDFEKINDMQLLKDRAYQAIKEKILNLDIRPGEQLVEQRLADELGISKSPIREAFHRLETEGMICNLPYKGAFVTPISEKEARDLFQLREALELYAIAHGLEQYTDEAVKEFETIMEEAIDEIEDGQEYSAYMTHLSFHRLIIEKLDNWLIIDIYSNIQDRLKRYLNIVVKYNAERVRQSNAQHKDILEAMQQRNKPLAMERLKNHLSTVLHDFLVLKENRTIPGLDIMWIE